MVRSARNWIFFKSIRWQIQAWYGLLLLCASILFCWVAYQVMWMQKSRDMDNRLSEKSIFLVNSLREVALDNSNFSTLIQDYLSEDTSPLTSVLIETLRSGKIEIPASFKDTFSGTEPGFFYFRIINQEGSVVLMSNNAPVDKEIYPAASGKLLENSKMVGQRRERTLSEGSRYRLLVGQDVSREIAQMNQIATGLVLFSVVLWGMSLLVGWIIAGKAFRPIREISEAAARISGGNLDERIQLNGSGNELDQLASILNRSFEQLQAALKRQLDFTADASHELRTPVSVILSEAQRMKKKNRSKQEYQKGAEICYEAGIRMKQIIENLLLLARQDGLDQQLRIESCDLTGTLSGIAGSFDSLAEEKSIQIHLELRSIVFRTDPFKFTILINNILSNAIFHHRGDGNVWISTSVNDSMVHISIRDDGPGISRTDLPHIFERFYRADKSRSQQDNHFGLGLAVCKSIISQFQGSLDVKSEKGVGSEFIISIPLDPKIQGGHSSAPTTDISSSQFDSRSLTGAVSNPVNAQG